jgi:hypothetical protein
VIEASRQKSKDSSKDSSKDRSREKQGRDRGIKAEKERRARPNEFTCTGKKNGAV